MSAVRLALYAAIAGAIFLAFGWPYLVSSDPADPAFRVAALATVCMFFGTLAACCALRMR